MFKRGLDKKLKTVAEELFIFIPVDKINKKKVINIKKKVEYSLSINEIFLDAKLYKSSPTNPEFPCGSNHQE